MAEKEKALVIETGEIFDVVNNYQYFLLNYKFGIDPSKSDDESSWTKDLKSNDKLGQYYTLSDLKSYKEELLIIGYENIREYKIKNQLKLDE